MLTCIDSRIDPLAMLGLRVGDAKIIRNAGARVTDDALRSLILATNLLDAERVCIVHHTDCAVGSKTEEELRAAVESVAGDVGTRIFHGSTDRLAALAEDVAAIKACELIPDSVTIGAFVYDVHTGELIPVDL